MLPAICSFSSHVAGWRIAVCQSNVQQLELAGVQNVEHSSNVLDLVYTRSDLPVLH